MTKAIEVVSADITTREWYASLVEDCRAIVAEAVFTSRWALVEGYHALGERITTDANWKPHARDEGYVQGLADSVGISTRTVHYARQFYEKYPDLASLPEGKNITWNKLITKYLPAPKAMIAPQLPLGTYRVIYADPPWQFDNSGFEQSAASHYPTLATEDICKLLVPAAKASALFLWATNAMLPDAMQVLDAWEFEYKTNLVWVKDRGPTIGWYVHSRHELLLIGIRGDIEHPLVKPLSVIEEKNVGHSRKPDAVYGIIESMYPGPYLEMFARQKRRGWEAWGNEI